MGNVAKILDNGFYTDQDVVTVARKLIGKILVSNLNGTMTSGRIVETEAYSGFNDLACHASKGKSARTQVMFEDGGHSYVYLCYGIHHLFNVVTNKKGIADAVLIRALEPITGLDQMIVRRKKKQLDNSLTMGPGSLAKAMGINIDHYGMSLTKKKQLWIYENVDALQPVIKCSPRIGVAYAKRDASLPWRFYEFGNKWVSKGANNYTS